MDNPLKEMVVKRQHGIHCGIPSFCCANKIVIEAILDQAQRFGDSPLIEATSNQVNQNGGYMDMTPMDFTEYVYKIADRLQISRDKIYLGGDHMGPLPWVDRPAAEAMENAKVLVRQCVKAGYKKIHLDTSMRLGDDSRTEKLSDLVVAERGAVLYAACEEAYQEMLKENPDEMHPIFVIGSEVPVPGGINEDDAGMEITDPRDFEHTLMAYKEVFHQHGLDDAWDYIIAVVVQPGVEFGDDTIHLYDHDAAKSLCRSLKKYPDIVFEGHSTDYQPAAMLKQMVEDGIAIIKVGPALTFALREGLYALSFMEDELITDPKDRSHFREVLENEMVKNPKHWQNYYTGSEAEKKIKRSYSFSDRSRYYMSLPVVEDARRKLFENIDSLDIPMSMLKQYMPLQYIKVRDGSLSMKARELAKDSVVTLIEDYNYAVKYNYMISGIFVR
jgi:D-tagatose-1,6-bisphosphate aldolase subunit GatZ/KbaZ